MDLPFDPHSIKKVYRRVRFLPYVVILSFLMVRPALATGFFGIGGTLRVGLPSRGLKQDWYWQFFLSFHVAKRWEVLTEFSFSRTACMGTGAWSSAAATSLGIGCGRFSVATVSLSRFTKARRPGFLPRRSVASSKAGNFCLSPESM